MAHAHSARGSLCTRLSSTCSGLCARDTAVTGRRGPDLRACTASRGAGVARTSAMAGRVEALGPDQGIRSEEVTLNGDKNENEPS